MSVPIPAAVNGAATPPLEDRSVPWWNHTVYVGAWTTQFLWGGRVNSETMRTRGHYPAHFVDDTNILSRLPLLSELPTFEELARKRGKKLAFLQLVEDFELKGKCWITPLSRKRVEDTAVRIDQIRARDFHDLPQKTMDEAIGVLKKNDAEGYLTVTHCKSGSGRSAGALVTYMVLKQLEKETEKLSKEQVHAAVDTEVARFFQLRPTVHLPAHRRPPLYEYVFANQ
jgi:hypothetical protein